MLVILFLGGGTASANKKRIAVASFENHTQYKEVGSGVADLFVVELVKNKNFEVIERSKLNQVLSEQRLGATGVISEESAAKLGKLLGLDYLVFGSVTGIQGSKQNILGVVTQKISVTMSMRLVDATTGSIILADSAEGTVSATSLPSSTNPNEAVIGSNLGGGAPAEAARKAVVKLVDKINDVNPLEGVVVKVSGNTVYIDLGREQGVQSGHKYEVFFEGNVITHPVTGKIIGVEKGKIGEIKITSVESGMSIGQSQGGVIVVGNKVRKIK